MPVRLLRLTQGAGTKPTRTPTMLPTDAFNAGISRRPTAAPAQRCTGMVMANIKKLIQREVRDKVYSRQRQSVVLPGRVSAACSAKRSRVVFQAGAAEMRSLTAMSHPHLCSASHVNDPIHANDPKYCRCVMHGAANPRQTPQWSSSSYKKRKR